MIYWFISLLTAAIAFFFGNIDPLLIASTFVFRKNLKKLGTGNNFLSNFHRLFGITGWIKYGLTEIIIDIIPVLVGLMLFAAKGHPREGMALAGYCLTVSRMWCLISTSKGSNGYFPLIVTTFAVNPIAGATALVASLIFGLSLRYVSICTFTAGIAAFLACAVLVDETLVIQIMAILGALVLIKNSKGFINAMTGREERITFRRDLTYKLDEKF